MKFIKMIRMASSWGIFTLCFVALLTPAVGWAHKCGPAELTVEKGSVVVYSIRGHDFVPSYEIVDRGDPLVAVIEPPVDIENVSLVFRIIGTGEGTTVFQIHWKGPRNQATCPVKVIVSG